MSGGRYNINIIFLEGCYVVEGSGRNERRFLENKYHSGA